MKFELEVSEEQLAKVEGIVKRIDGSVKSIDPLKFLKVMFQTELGDLDRYIGDTCLDEGGNGVGDVLSDEQCKEIVVFQEGYDEFGNCSEDEGDDE